MGTPAEDAAYQRALNEYRAWCSSMGQSPQPGHIEDLARNYHQGAYASGMASFTPRPSPADAPSAVPVATGTAQNTTGGYDDYTNSVMTSLFGPNWQETLGLNVQPGYDWHELAVQAGVDVYIANLEHEIEEGQLEVNRLNAEAHKQSAAAAAASAANQIAAAEIAAEASRYASDKAAETARYVADLQAELDRMRIDLEERQYGAQLSAHPVNTVEYEEWKRAGGKTGAPKLPEVPTAPTAPTVPGVSTGIVIFSPKGSVPVGAAKGKVVSPGLLQVGEGKGGWEYVFAPPGTVVAPRAKGETKPTQEGGQRAVNKQLGQVTSMARGGGVGQAGRPGLSAIGEMQRANWQKQKAQGRAVMWLTSNAPSGLRYGQYGRAPGAIVLGPGGSGLSLNPALYAGIGKRQPLRGRTAPNPPEGYVPVQTNPRQRGGGRPQGAQGGANVSGTHTDEEMAELLAGILGRRPMLYNPYGAMGGTEGVYGAYIPNPNEISRRQYGTMDPGSRSVLESYIAAGVPMGEGEERTAIYVPDWLKQMQQSWIPSLAEAGRGTGYAY